MDQNGRLETLLKKIASPRVLLKRQWGCIKMEPEGTIVMVLVKKDEAREAGIRGSKFIQRKGVPRGFAFIKVAVDRKDLSLGFRLRDGKQVTVDVADGPQGLKAVNFKDGVLRRG